MPSKKTFNNLSEKQKDLDLKIFDLVIGRVLKKTYLKLKETEQKKMEEVFLSDNNKEKENFIKNQMPNFKELFEAEAKKVEKEIKAEIKGHI